MIISTLVLGWIGVLLFFIIVFSFRTIAAHNEFAFLHVIMVFMYAMWLPLPIALYQLLNSELLLAGTVFGITYLLMLVITMTLQTGHISHIVKQKSVSEQQGAYMMATLSMPFEGIANVFKSIWALFLAIAFWNSGEWFMAGMMIFFSALFFYYICIVLEASLVKSVFSNVKPNPYFINLETLLFFILLMSYLSLRL